MTGVIRRNAGHATRMTVLLAFVLATTGCTEPGLESPNARIVPSSGVVPYEATVKVDPIADTYVFRLPDRTVTQDSPQLPVTVDRITYNVKVECRRQDQIAVGSARAIGTNAAPQILGVRVNGIADLWLLKPFERTLLEPIVSYEGDWALSSLQVTGSIYVGPYSTFHPPYEPGVPHAEWRGQDRENAAIVYPLYMSIENDYGLPYSPTGLDEGYPTSYSVTNAFEFGSSGSADTSIPAQAGTLRVSVKDEFGRTTSASFEIPISATGFVDLKH